MAGYDYSQPGMYFVTICCQNRAGLFGTIENGEMFLNDAGQMIEKWYLELKNKFLNVQCGDYIIMPNHFHAIIILLGGNNEPKLFGHAKTKMNGHEKTKMDGHKGPSLPEVMQWFKTMTTNEYIRGVKQFGWKPFNGKMWQRSYYEHIIRNEKSYINIKNYILNNPKNWNNDKLNTNEPNS